jgi:4-hydroxybenzoyl-CoA reductase subunit beta
MMRLPWFRHRAPRTIDEAARIVAGEGAGAMLLAGGTDVLPNMKRRQQVPHTLVSLGEVENLRRIENGAELRIGATVTLAQIVRDRAVRASWTGLWQAAAQVATPQIRNMGTLGGNLCLDTRCTYYDQTEDWRRAIGYCLKKDGNTCWVAPSSAKCLAVSSTDTAPALFALGARVRLASAAGERTVAVADLYRNDGIHYSVRRPDEILTEVALDPAPGWRSAYWKLRRRGSFDFPVLSAAVAVRCAAGTVEQARIVLGAVASRPLSCDEAAARLIGTTLGDAAVAEAATLAAKLAKPMDNTDFTLHWRKRVVAEFVGYALREVRGDPMDETRRRIARHDLDACCAPAG